jgi:hypothetical protein
VIGSLVIQSEYVNPKGSSMTTHADMRRGKAGASVAGAKAMTGSPFLECRVHWLKVPTLIWRMRVIASWPQGELPTPFAT